MLNRGNVVSGLRLLYAYLLAINAQEVAGKHDIEGFITRVSAALELKGSASFKSARFFIEITSFWRGDYMHMEANLVRDLKSRIQGRVAQTAQAQLTALLDMKTAPYYALDMQRMLVVYYGGLTHTPWEGGTNDLVANVGMRDVEFSILPADSDDSQRIHLRVHPQGNHGVTVESSDEKVQADLAYLLNLW